MSRPMRLLLISLLLLGSLSAKPTAWTQLQLGMSAEQIVTLLGSPLLRIRGHGFETWTYDHGAEVLIHGTVVGWTAPATARLLIRSADVWSTRRMGEHYATLHTGLPAATKKPAKVTTPPVRAKTPSASRGIGYEDYIRG